MKWNINYLEDLYKKFDSVDQTKLTTEELNHKSELAEVINCFYNKQKYLTSYSSTILLDPERFCDIPDEFAKNIRKVAINISGNFSQDYIKTGRGIMNRISEEEYLKIVSDFLKEKYPNIYQTFLNLQKEERIHLQPRRINKSTVLGRVYPLANYSNVYAVAYFNNSFQHSSVLVHELSHADFMISDIPLIIKQNSMYSVFLETAPKYLELSFAKYLIDIGYLTEGQRFIHDFIDLFICNLDCNYNIISSATPGSVQRSHSIKAFVSDLMTLKLFSTSLDDENKGKELYIKFCNEIGRKKDYEMFDEYNLSDSKSNFLKIYKYYLNEIESYSKERQIKRSRLFLKKSNH